MRKTILALLVVIISVVGMVDAGYISYEKFSGRIPPCNAIFKCGEVLESPYAYIGPLPLAVYGFGFYLTFFVLGSWYFLNIDRGESQLAQKLRLGMAVLGVFGFIFSLYLLFLMAVVIQAWCIYCLLSAVNCVLLFCTSMAIYLMGRQT